MIDTMRRFFGLPYWDISSETIKEWDRKAEKVKIDDWHKLPDFHSRADAARAAVDYAEQAQKEGRSVAFTYGGPMWPADPGLVLYLKEVHNIEFRAVAGCEICNYEDVWADTVNVVAGSHGMVNRMQIQWRKGHGQQEDYSNTVDTKSAHATVDSNEEKSKC